MWRPGDRIAQIKLKQLKLSLATNSFYTAGQGILFRAKETEDGYQISVRRPKTGISAKFRIKTAMIRSVSFAHIFTQGMYCAKCGKLGRRVLFLDWDTLTAQCKFCIGLTGHPITNVTHEDFNERSRFNRLMKQRILAAALRLELEAMKRESAEEFFLKRPWLFPVFGHFIREASPWHYNRMMKFLYRVYKDGIGRYRGIRTRPTDDKWLDEQIEKRISSRAYGFDKEEMWKLLKEFRKQYGTERVRSSSRPTETACLSSKTPSSPDTNASPATEPESGNVIIAEEEATTIG